MRVPISISALLHIAFIAVLILGVPWFQSEPQDPTPPVIEVQMAEVADKTTPPKPAPEVKPAPPKPEPPKPEPKPEPPKPPPPPPEPPKPAPPPPEPPKPAPPKPEPKVEAPPPEPLPEPKPKEPPKKVAETPPAPVPTPKVKPSPPKPAFDPTQLAALLDKRIKKDTPAPAPDKPAAKAAPQQQAATPSIDPNQKLTVSEIDLIRAQIIANWFPPFGAKDAADMEVYVRIALNPDGTLAGNPSIARASKVAPEQMQPFIDSTIRAILKSQPLKVPPGKYEAFREITLRFNMKDMLGG